VVFADAITMSGVYGPLVFQEPFWLDIETGPYGGLVQWRHRRMANVAYLDSHVDQVSQRDGNVLYPSVAGSAAGTLTTGDVDANSPYGSPQAP
jgi:prepilin-type processing-associated H-X9-DG protein